MLLDGSQPPWDKKAQAGYGEEPRPPCPQSPLTSWQAAGTRASLLEVDPQHPHYKSCRWWAVPSTPSPNCRHVSKTNDCCSLRPLSLWAVCNIGSVTKQEHVIFASFLLSSREERRLRPFRVFITRFRHFQRENHPRGSLFMSKHTTPLERIHFNLRKAQPSSSSPLTPTRVVAEP